MDTTPAISRFDEFYKTTIPPWVIGEPQPAVVELERAGLIRGKVLDVGCGTGEHTILLTGLGYDVLGIDFAPEAVEQARRNADAKGAGARFEVADADRPKYVASLHGAVLPGGIVHVLALSDQGRGFGPQVSGETIRDAFGDGWELEALEPATYRGVVTEVHADDIGLPIGTRVDEPAWLARARHIPGGRP